MGVASHFTLQLANHKLQRFDFGAVCCLAVLSDFIIAGWFFFFFYEKEGTTILEIVAFLLRLSIVFSSPFLWKWPH